MKTPLYFLALPALFFFGCERETFDILAEEELPREVVRVEATNEIAHSIAGETVVDTFGQALLADFGWFRLANYSFETFTCEGSPSGFRFSGQNGQRPAENNRGYSFSITGKFDSIDKPIFADLLYFRAADTTSTGLFRSSLCGDVEMVITKTDDGRIEGYFEGEVASFREFGSNSGNCEQFIEQDLLVFADVQGNFSLPIEYCE